MLERTPEPAVGLGAHGFAVMIEFVNKFVARPTNRRDVHQTFAAKILVGLVVKYEGVFPRL
jgi:hypothetical protein